MCCLLLRTVPRDSNHVQDSSFRFLDAATGGSVATVPPQLSTHTIRASLFDALAGRLYVLLGNSDVHVWSVLRDQATSIVDIWTHLAREKLTCLCLLVSGSIPRQRAQAFGLCGSHEEPPDLIAAGNEDGDVVFLLPSSGQLAMRICAHRLTCMTHIFADADACRLLTATSKGVKVWDLEKGVRMLRATDTPSPVVCGTVAAKCFVLGTAKGGVVFVSTKTGTELPLLSEATHGRRTATMQASAYLQHSVSASPDGTLKLWNAERRLARTVRLGRAVSCACFLNHAGDLLCGIGEELVLVQARMYNCAPAQRNDSSLRRAGGVFEGMEGNAMAPLELQRAARSPLTVAGTYQHWWVAHDTAGAGTASSSASSVEDSPSADSDVEAPPALQRAATDVAGMDVAALAAYRKAQQTVKYAEAGTQVRAETCYQCRLRQAVLQLLSQSADTWRGW